MKHPTIPAVEVPPDIVDAIKLTGSTSWEKFFEQLENLECLKLRSTEDIELPKLKARIEGMRYVHRLIVDVATYSKNTTNQKTD